MTIDATALIGFLILVVGGVAGAIFRKRQRSNAKSVDLVSSQESDEPVIEFVETNQPKQIMIGSDPLLPLAKIRAVAQINDLEKTKSIDIENEKSVSTLSVLCQAVPSLLVAGEASGKRLVEVVINGDLVRAANGKDLRAFAMNGKGIVEHARLLEVGNLQNMINAAALWQVASVLVAQKHLADISEKLDAIKDGVEHILTFLDTQRKSRVQAIYGALKVIHSTIMAGELPNSALEKFEQRDEDLSEIYIHLCDEYRKEADSEAKHTDIVGTEELAGNIRNKISKLEDISEQISMCLKVRVVAWYLWTLFPGDNVYKRKRKEMIETAIRSFSELVSPLEKGVDHDIQRIKAIFNRGKTISERKNELRDKRDLAARSLEDLAVACQECITQSERMLLECNRQSTYYLNFDNGVLVEARSAI